MLKRLFSHSAIYGLAPQIPKIVGILVLPIITAHLTKLDFGIFGLITAVSGSIAAFANLGLNVVLSNSFYKSPMRYKIAWRQIYGFLILWNIPYAFLLAGIIWYFIPIEAASNTWNIILLNTIPIVFFGPTSIMGSLYYQLSQRPVPIVVRGAIVGFLTIGLNVYFIAFREMGYMGWFLSAAIGQMAIQLTYWVPLNRSIKITPIFNFKWRFIRRQLAVSLPTVPHYYSAYLLNTSDRLVMKLVNISTGNIGLYNAANTVGNIMLMMGNASGQAIGPMLLKAYKASDEYLARRLVFSLQITFFLATFLSSIWLKEIFYILIKNNGLNKVYPLGIIIVMAYNYRPMYFGANSRLFYHERTKILLKVTFLAGISTLLLNFIFIPFWGYEVAAYTTFIGLMYMGYAGYFLREFKQNCDVNYYPFRWLTITIILTLVAYFVVEWSIILKLLISGITLLIAFLSVKRVNLNEE
ncbi:MAG: oligosaccharide flippase family protein [Ginsengibacter sp.]